MPNRWNSYVRGTCSPGYQASRAARASKKKAKLSASRKRRRMPESFAAVGHKRGVKYVLGKHIKKK